MGTNLDDMNETMEQLRDCFQALSAGLQAMLKIQAQQTSMLTDIKKRLDTEPPEEGGGLGELLRAQTAELAGVRAALHGLPAEMEKAVRRAIAGAAA